VTLVAYEVKQNKLVHCRLLQQLWAPSRVLYNVHWLRTHRTGGGQT